MNKTIKIYGILLLIVIAILAVFEVNKSEVLDWRKSFDVNKKTPFGLFVFNEEASYLFKNKLEKTNLSPFEYYRENKTSTPHNIFIFNKKLDNESWKKILTEVEKGSDVLMFSQNIDYQIYDTLNISTKSEYHDSLSLHLTDIKLVNQYINIDKLPTANHFSYLPENHTILGYSENTKKQKIGVNFIEIPFGKGRFLFHLEPLIITNYHLLKSENEKYTESVFSFLPDRKTIWFTEDYKKNISSSPLRFILDNAGLRYAWWLLLVGLLLFMFFNAKRKQRIVPIIEPIKNKSVEFVKSIGNLYLQEGSPRDMAQKKIQYFLHKIRTELMIDTKTLDDVFIKKLHSKTGKSLEKITDAIHLIRDIEKSHKIKQEDLIKINHILDEILK